jgi:hypothetical protein
VKSRVNAQVGVAARVVDAFVALELAARDQVLASEAARRSNQYPRSRRVSDATQGAGSRRRQN